LSQKLAGVTDRN